MFKPPSIWCSMMQPRQTKSRCLQVGVPLSPWSSSNSTCSKKSSHLSPRQNFSFLHNSLFAL